MEMSVVLKNDSKFYLILSLMYSDICTCLKIVIDFSGITFDGTDEGSGC